MSPQFYSFQRAFSDVDDLAEEARNWDLDFRQLDHGRFSGTLLQFGAGGVHIADARFCRTLRQLGAPPIGLRTVGVPAHKELRLIWRGKNVTGNDLMVFPVGCELDSVSQPDFHVYTCSFPEALLDEICRQVQASSWDELCSAVDVIRCRPAAITRLRSLLHALTQQAINSQSLCLLRQLTYELPRQLIGTLMTAHGCVTPLGSRKRELALMRAEAYIEDRINEDIRVADVCRVAGVSPRTLEYAFRERFGVSPKTFIRAQRLTATRRELRFAGTQGTTVADVANAYGFWHLGQFAADYRRQFGELPSDTLRSLETVRSTVAEHLLQP